MCFSGIKRKQKEYLETKEALRIGLVQIRKELSDGGGTEGIYENKKKDFEKPYFEKLARIENELKFLTENRDSLLWKVVLIFIVALVGLVTAYISNKFGWKQ